MNDRNLIDLARFIEQISQQSKKYVPCMAIFVDQDSNSVDFVLDTSIDYYSEWISGEGADICLHRERGTDKVVGCHLPLMNNRFSVYHDGPIAINDGFKADYTKMPVVELIDILLQTIREAPIYAHIHERLKTIKESIFMELPETRCELLCRVGSVINETIPAERESFWDEVKSIMYSAFEPYR